MTLKKKEAWHGRIRPHPSPCMTFLVAKNMAANPFYELFASTVVRQDLVQEGAAREADEIALQATRSQAAVVDRDNRPNGQAAGEGGLLGPPAKMRTTE